MNLEGISFIVWPAAGAQGAGSRAPDKGAGPAERRCQGPGRQSKADRRCQAPLAVRISRMRRSEARRPQMQRLEMVYSTAMPPPERVL